MPQESFIPHLLKCKETNKKDYAPCRYNPYHVVLKITIDQHYSKCIEALKANKQNGGKKKQIEDDDWHVDEEDVRNQPKPQRNNATGNQRRGLDDDWNEETTKADQRKDQRNERQKGRRKDSSGSSDDGDWVIPGRRQCYEAQQKGKENPQIKKTKKQPSQKDSDDREQILGRNHHYAAQAKAKAKTALVEEKGITLDADGKEIPFSRVQKMKLDQTNNILGQLYEPPKQFKVQKFGDSSDEELELEDDQGGYYGNGNQEKKEFSTEKF